MNREGKCRPDPQNSSAWPPPPQRSEHADRRLRHFDMKRRADGTLWVAPGLSVISEAMLREVGSALIGVCLTCCSLDYRSHVRRDGRSFFVCMLTACLEKRRSVWIEPCGHHIVWQQWRVMSKSSMKGQTFLNDNKLNSFNCHYFLCREKKNHYFKTTCSLLKKKETINDSFQYQLATEIDWSTNMESCLFGFQGKEICHDAIFFAIFKTVPSLYKMSAAWFHQNTAVFFLHISYHGLGRICLMRWAVFIQWFNLTLDGWAGMPEPQLFVNKH